MTVDPTLKAELAQLVKQLAVIHGEVILSSGKKANYYVDLRRVSLSARGAPLIGQLLRQLTADWDYDHVGGLTLGADPVAAAMLHAPGRPLDAFVVRKTVKEHGLARRIEGPDIAGDRVLIVEDTSSTGNSPLKAVAAAREAGATVAGVAAIVDRATGAQEAITAAGLQYRYLLDLVDLGLAPDYE